MNDKEKTKAILINELEEMRKQIAKLEAAGEGHKKGEVALKESEEFNRLLLENAPNPILVQNPDTSIRYANPAFEKLVGYSSSEIIGKKVPYHYWPPEKVNEYLNDIQKHFHQDYPFSGIREFVNKSGKHVWVSLKDQRIFDREGKFKYSISNYLDITQQKKAEDALRENQNKYQSLVETTSDFIWEMNLEGVYTYCSPQIEKLWGIKPEGMLGKTPFDLLPPEDREQAIKGFARLLGSASPFTNMETRSFNGNGQVVYLEISGVPFFDTTGKNCGYRGITRDITERKQAEEAIRQSEETLQQEKEFAQSIINTAQTIILILDKEGRIQHFNPYMEEISGYRLEEVQGKDWFETFLPERDRSSIRSLFKKSLDGVPNLGNVNNIITKDGRERYIEWYDKTQKDSDGNIIGLLAIGQDITEHKKAEVVLKESEEFSANLLNKSPNPIVVISPDTSIKYVNPAVETLTGFSSQELIGKKFPYPYWPENEISQSIQSFRQTQKAGVGNRLFKTFRKKSGEVFWVEITTNPIKIKGEGGYHLANWVDITEHKQAEEAIIVERMRLNRLLETVPAFFILLTQDYHVTFANRFFREHFGEDHGRRCFEYLFGRTEPCENCVTYTTLKTMKPQEWEWTGPDGHNYQIYDQPFAETDGSNCIMEMGIDITSRKQAEERENKLKEELVTSSRLATVGEMAAGISHEINNPLTGVVGFSDLLLKKKDLPEDIRKDVEIIHEGALRIASIIDRMLKFSRQSKPMRTNVNINDIIETTLAMRASEMKVNNIKVTTEFDPDLPLTDADAGLLQQSFLNIILNAEMAMKEAHGKGKLVVKTERIDNTIRVSFKDDGPGIKRENMDKLFNPFFTTKDPDKGTGLGLSISHSIIKQHDGKIYAESTPDKGATFFIELPIVSKGEQLILDEPAIVEPDIVSKARILVVDDEPIVQEFVTAVLSGKGHEVEVVGNGDVAMERLGSEDYDVILLDIKLPGQSGIEIYRELEKKDKSTTKKLIFITGDVMSADTMDFIRRTRIPYIAKPFDAARLVEEIGRIISQ